ncbi:zinc finger CCCH domain-containing protein 11 isoform X1 [Lolium perenne]|uniref:zinc finger CCCH domain-containing protein 11 isoform X1 n=1 Tax=Lolium perenne TaxID=4522 RepID=UPI0021F5E7F2|nr:zinc finger CCCH domain-containing protein 11 isoform X1 [Lolium perenne]
MPPKKAPAKADLAKKQKVVEDKTFGLKNKNKSKAVQKYVQQISQSGQVKPDAAKTAAKARDNSQIEAVDSPHIRLVRYTDFLCLFLDVDLDAQKKKEEEKAREKELNDLFKVAVSQPKVPVGVDPKSILCEFFKAGQCVKGFKCKFSHDLNVQRKGEKIDIYSDKRDGEEDTMDDWDQETLEKVIQSKNAEYQQNKPTDIVCKHFLDAVEKKQYGWFWVCPNGGKECRYRHALPPGYVLKSQMKALLEEESQKVAIEDEIEDQRKKVQTTTPMTTELFMEWKRRKAEEKEAGLAALRADRAKNDRMSGRELFMADASVFIDDAEAYEVYERREEPQASQEQAKKSQDEGPSSSTSNGKEGDEELDDEDMDDDDDLDLDELNELEASLSRTSIQIREPGEGTSS